jgi:hypothetical protein
MRYSVSADAACAVVEDGAVVLNMRTKRYYSLNETGTVIWRLLEEEMPVADIVARLVEQYDVEPGVASAAVSKLLDDLTSEALIEAVPS